jgi:hypothetical protein
MIWFGFRVPQQVFGRPYSSPQKVRYSTFSVPGAIGYWLAPSEEPAQKITIHFEGKRCEAMKLSIVQAPQQKKT